ncbi:MAG: hypothetical protein KDK39_00435 [Leptospiraceae bacterium]|nr:hypothetical protein [Leptospiraceae bacterium]
MRACRVRGLLGFVIVLMSWGSTFATGTRDKKPPEKSQPGPASCANFKIGRFDQHCSSNYSSVIKRYGPHQLQTIRSGGWMKQNISWLGPCKYQVDTIDADESRSTAIGMRQLIVVVPISALTYRTIEYLDGIKTNYTCTITRISRRPDKG